MDRRQYFRHFMIILSGNSAAQALNLLSYPLLARLYTPQAFGLFAIFVAASAIPGSLACARFDLAIPIAPRSGRRGILWLCLITACTTGLLSVGGTSLYWHLRGTPFQSSLPFLLGLTVTLTGVVAAASTYLLRHNHYRLTSTAIFIRTGGAVALQITLGLIDPTALSLILGFVLGLAGQALLLTYFMWRRASPGAPRVRDMRAMFYRFRRQVGLDLPSTLLSSFSVNLLTILLGSLYGQRAVGFYAVGNRLASVPLQLINDALSQIFFQKAARARETKGHFWEEMKFSTLTSGLLSLVALAGMVLLAKPFVELYLGPAWRPSATMLIILAPMLAMMSLAQSSATAVFVLGKTHWRLLHTSALVLLHLALFAIARSFDWSVYTYLIAVSLTFVLAWAVYAVILLNSSRRAFIVVTTVPDALDLSGTGAGSRP